jgi:hypothetical protein
MHYHPFYITLSRHCGNSLVVLCLADRTPLEVEWQVALMRLGLLYPTGSWMEFLTIGIDGRWFNMRPGGATKGKWSIPDGKVRERSVIMFGAPKVVTLSCVD